MKKHAVFTLLLCSLVLVSGTGLAASSSSSSALSVGLRHHTEHSAWETYPFDEGDLSYGLAYEYHESGGAWQLACTYGANVGEQYPADYVVTPQVNLLLKDNFWRLGVGALASYVGYEDGVVDASEAAAAEAAALAAEEEATSEETTVDVEAVEDGWTDIYWQFLAGISIPLGGMNLDLTAAYPFKDWGDLSDFDSSDIEVVVWLGFTL